METKQFKAESKRLLEMMINSIYTHKEIFLRELISNASDAIDKLYFKSLTENNEGMNRNDFYIRIDADKDARLLKISDNGIGMTADELENNLGVIAQSGSLAFKTENTLKDDVNIIGQFGVGFYSAFMAAKTVTVKTKAFGSDDAFEWKSQGVEGYTISPCDKDSHGTEIILEIKDDTEDEDYCEFLDQYKLQSLVKKYSDYIRYPIKMDMLKRRLKDGSEDEYEDYTETVTLNSMVPIWKKNKNELSDDDYNNFYIEKFYDYTNPLLHIHIKTEGTATYNAIVYIPSKAPYDYYTKEYEKGLQLYSNGVLIMDKCSDLVPDYFSFAKGIVDSEDLSLNISREMLQHDRQLKIIAKSIEKTIRSELQKLMQNDRDKYQEFFNAFGLQLKFGIYNGFGANKDALKDLLLFHSSTENKPISLSEYVSRMKEDQKYIYYAAGENISAIDRLPQTELVKDKGFEILYCTQNVDEFALKMLAVYEDKEFKSVSAGDLDIETPEEKEEFKAKSEESKDLFEFMKDALNGKVKSVRLSSRLKTHPVCLSSDGDLSLEMEKVLNAMPTDHQVSAEKVLEINPEHEIFQKLKSLYDTDKDKLSSYATILYNQALLIEGISIEDPVDFSLQVCKLML